MHWNWVRNDAKSFHQHKYGMVGALKHEAIKEDYTWGMQYMANMYELSMDRVEMGLNKDQNVLRWVPKDLGMQAYTLGHKLGNKSTTLKGT